MEGAAAMIPRILRLTVPLGLAAAAFGGCVVAPAPGYYAPRPAYASVYVAPRPYYYRSYPYYRPYYRRPWGYYRW
jgi:hypothetical protein